MVTRPLSPAGGPAGIRPSALAAAAARAIESGRSDPLVVDPFAARLVAGSGLPTVWPDHGAPVSGAAATVLDDAAWTGLRTRAVDDAVASWLGGPGGPAQVVLLGSGLDTRAWRLPWPARTRVYEVAGARVHTHNHRLLADPPPVPEPVPAGADLAGGWHLALQAAGHDPNRPTWWVAEGVLTDLTTGSATAMLATIATSAPGSRAVLEASDGPDPAAVLARAGWQVDQVDADDLQIRYRRSLRDPRLTAAAREQPGRAPRRLVLARRAPLG